MNFKYFNSIKVGKFLKRFSLTLLSLFAVSSIPVGAVPPKKQTSVGKQHYKTVKKTSAHKAAPKKAVVSLKKALAPKTAPKKVVVMIKKALAPKPKPKKTSSPKGAIHKTAPKAIIKAPASKTVALKAVVKTLARVASKAASKVPPIKAPTSKAIASKKPLSKQSQKATRQQKAAQALQEMARERAAREEAARQQERAAQARQQEEAEQARQQEEAEQDFLHHAVFVKEERMREPLDDALDIEFITAVDLGYEGALARTQQYADANLNFPTAPVLHPYHPSENLINYKAPVFTLNIKHPPYIPEMVPEAIRANLLDVARQNIRMHTIFQDMPYDGVPLQLKPQYGLAPNTPTIFTDPSDTQNFRTKAGIFSRQNPNCRIHGQLEGELVETRGLEICVHPDGTAQNHMISSSDVLSIDNLDFNESQILYSITKELDKVTSIPKRTFVVRHVLLNQEDQNAFNVILGISNNLTELKNQVIQAKTHGGHFATLEPDEMLF